MAALPNLILIGIDNLRADLVSSFPDKTLLQDFLADDHVPETPTLDALAGESFWFQTCVSAAGYTPPSFATAFTGAYPYRHGVVDFLFSRLNPKTATIFEQLRDRGYRTAWLAREPELLATAQVTRGIETLCVNEEQLFAFAAAHTGEPVCLFAHFFDCHKPFMWTDYDRPGANDDFFTQMKRLFGEDLQPLAADSKQLLARTQQLVESDIAEVADPQEHYAKCVELYLRGIAKFDAGRLADFLGRLQQAGLWDNSYVATFSDHGEIRERVRVQTTDHGPYTGEALTRVVCMIRGPEVPTGTNQDLVGLVDLTPTLLDLLGVEPNSELDGCSLAPLMRGTGTLTEPRWYLQEGWLHYLDSAAKPVRLELAVRTEQNRRYVLSGGAGSIEESSVLSEDELAPWLSTTFYPIRWELPEDRRHLEEALDRVGRDALAGAIELLLNREKELPRHIIYDMNADPLERHPIRVSFAPEVWEDYLGKYRWMQARAAWHPPAPATGERPTEAEESELVEKLRALGYQD